MNKTLTSLVALAGLAAAAGVAQAEDAVVGGDTMELSLSQMDEVTAGRVCVVCANVAVVTQNAAALAYAIQAGIDNENEAEAENDSEIDQDIN